MSNELWIGVAIGLLVVLAIMVFALLLPPSKPPGYGYSKGDGWDD